jgi:hypothetical protein
MIISNSNKYIFIHIPKCAGTSVTHALADCFRWNDLVLGSTEFGAGIESAYKQKFGLEKHSTVQDVTSVVGSKVWSEYFTFTFVRNPLSRIVSWYTFAKRIFNDQNLLRRQAPWLYEFLGKPVKSQAPVVRAYLDSDSFSQFLRHDGCFGDDGTKPQVDWLWGDEEEDRIPVDYIGHFESIQDDFQRISELIGVEASLPRRNVSNTESCRQFYETERDVQIVLDRYAQDFDFLQYEKTLPRW